MRRKSDHGVRAREQALIQLIMEQHARCGICEETGARRGPIERHICYAGLSGRLIPNFCIRLRNVLGFKLRILAAPRSPSIIQFVWIRIDSIWRRSTSFKEPPGGVGAGRTLVGLPSFGEEGMVVVPLSCVNFLPAG